MSPLSLVWMLLVGACPEPTGPTLLVVTSADPRLQREASPAEGQVRAVVGDRLSLLSVAEARQALVGEGGRAERQRSVLEARVRLERAFERFRELEATAALDLTAQVTAQLSAASQSPGAIGMMAEAHLLAGAIFLARGRVDAAQARLRRALQLAPDIRAPPTRYAPRVRAELAALRGDPGPRSTLVVELIEPAPDAEVFVDGRPVGRAPLRLIDLPAGRHLVRITAPERQSFHTTIQLTPTRSAVVRARLPVDPEVAQIADVKSWLGVPEARREVMALLARRAESDSVLLAELRIGGVRDATATATRAVVLRLDERPAQRVPLTRLDVEAGIQALLQCAPERNPSTLAPALLPWPAPKTATRPMVEPPPWWTKPWVWAAFAVIAVGAAGAVAAARNAEGPPDSVDITLIPRP